MPLEAQVTLNSLTGDRGQTRHRASTLHRSETAAGAPFLKEGLHGLRAGKGEALKDGAIEQGLMSVGCVLWLHAMGSSVHLAAESARARARQRERKSEREGEECL